MHMKIRISYFTSASFHFSAPHPSENETLIGISLLIGDVLRLHVSRNTKQSILQEGKDSGGIK